MKLFTKLSVLVFASFIFSVSYAKNITVNGVTYKSCKKGDSANGQTKFSCNAPNGSKADVSCSTDDVASTSSKYWMCSARSKGPKARCSFVKNANGTYKLTCQKMTKGPVKQKAKVKLGR